jgi:hypothetical protein
MNDYLVLIWAGFLSLAGVVIPEIVKMLSKDAYTSLRPFLANVVVHVWKRKSTIALAFAVLATLYNSFLLFKEGNPRPVPTDPLTVAYGPIELPACTQMVFPVPETGTTVSNYQWIVTEYKISSKASQNATDKKGNNAIHSINLEQRHAPNASTFNFYFNPAINYGASDPDNRPADCDNRENLSSIASDASITFVLLPTRFLQFIDGIQMSKP